jgi:hypothetical protein
MALAQADTTNFHDHPAAIDRIAAGANDERMTFIIPGVIVQNPPYQP